MMKISPNKLEMLMKKILKKSKLLTLDAYNKRSLSIKIKEDIAKLVSPIL